MLSIMSRLILEFTCHNHEGKIDVSQCLFHEYGFVAHLAVMGLCIGFIIIFS
jgi:hypothetical protein